MDSTHPTGLLFDVDVLSKTVWLSSQPMLHLSASNCCTINDSFVGLLAVSLDFLCLF